MEELFLQILSMNITASYVILLVLVVRMLLKKAPKSYSYALWSVVLFRLCCPFSFESMFSLLPVGGQTVSSDILTSQQPQISSGIAVLDRAVNAMLPAATPQNSINPMQIWVAIGAALWAAVAVGLVLYSLLAAARLKYRLKIAVQIEGNLYEMQGLPTAFVFGFPQAKIYLPAGLSHIEKSYILRHEQTHIKRLDHLVKPLAFLVLCVHWFNPIVWVAFCMCGKDMELSCDERVINELGGGIKQDYSASLLALSTGRKIIGGCPLAFGENDTKSRIKNVLNYKKPALWVAIVAVLAVVAVSVGLLANPKAVPTEKAFFIPDMDAEQQKFNQEYVEPILLTGLLRRDWSADNYTALLPDEAGRPDNALFYAFEDILGMETAMPILKQYSGKCPEKVIDDVLLSRFAFTTQQLHTILSPYYKADEKIYTYEEEGRGGGPIECAVTGITKQKDGTVIVEYLFMTSYYAEASTVEKDAYYDKTKGTLTLKPATGGGYLYQSVAIGEHTQISSAVL